MRDVVVCADTLGCCNVDCDERRGTKPGQVNSSRSNLIVGRNEGHRLQLPSIRR
jgi:hypothetical protein